MLAASETLSNSTMIVVSSVNKIYVKNIKVFERLSIYSINNKRPSIDLWGTPHDVCRRSDFEPFAKYIIQDMIMDALSSKLNL